MVTTQRPIRIIELTNLTSGVPFEEPERAQILELADNGFAFAWPALNCSAGHNLMFKLRAPAKSEEGPVSDLDLTATGAVHEIDPDGATWRIAIRFLQVTRTEWSAVLAAQGDAQADAQALFRRMKGE